MNKNKPTSLNDGFNAKLSEKLINISLIIAITQTIKRKTSLFSL